MVSFLWPKTLTSSTKKNLLNCDRSILWITIRGLKSMSKRLIELYLFQR